MGIKRIFRTNFRQKVNAHIYWNYIYVTRRIGRRISRIGHKFGLFFGICAFSAAKIDGTVDGKQNGAMEVRKRSNQQNFTTPLGNG